MKTIASSLIILTTVLLSSNVAAQSKYEKVMESSLETLDTAETLATINSLANRFERIALAEKNQWLAYYWSAYCYTISSFDNEIEGAQKDKYLDKALAYVDSGFALGGLKDELLLLQAFAYTGKIVVDPMSRGASLGPKAAASRKLANEANPENPRYYYMEGMNLIQMPAMWGGNKEKGKELLEMAIKKYDSFEPESKLHPKWGREQVEGMLERMEKETSSSESEETKSEAPEETE